MRLGKSYLKRRMRRNSSKIFRILTLITLVITIVLTMLGQRVYIEKSISGKYKSSNMIDMYAKDK